MRLFTDFKTTYQKYKRNKSMVDSAMAIIDTLNQNQPTHSLHFTLYLEDPHSGTNKHYGPRIPFKFKAKWNGVYLISIPDNYTVKLDETIKLDCRTPDVIFTFTIGKDGVLNFADIKRNYEKEES